MGYLIVVLMVLLAVAGMVWVTDRQSESEHLAEVHSLQRRIDALNRELSGLGEKVTPEQVEEALRGAGYEPSKGEDGVILFDLDGEKAVIRTGGLPFIPIDIAFKLDPRQNDFELLEKIAAEITPSLVIGKIFLDRELGCLLFRVGILAETRGGLSGQVRDVVTALSEMRKNFDEKYEAHSRMLREQCLLQELQSMKDADSVVPGKREICS